MTDQELAPQAEAQQVETPVTPEQAGFLGKKPVELVQTADGSLATRREADEMLAGNGERPQAGTPR